MFNGMVQLEADPPLLMEKYKYINWYVYIISILDSILGSKQGEDRCSI